MYSYNKMFKATISGIFAAYICCHQVKHLAQNLLFNAQSSNFFLMPLTFLQKTETRYIFLKEKWIMGHQKTLGQIKKKNKKRKKTITIIQTIICTGVDNGSRLLKHHNLTPLSLGLFT